MLWKLGIQVCSWKLGTCLLFLKMGTTSASLQSAGISPWSKDSWNSIARAGAYSSAAAFRMKAGIESGPVALYVLRFFKSLCTRFQSTLISTMLGVELVPLSGMLVRSSSVNIENIGS